MTIFRKTDKARLRGMMRCRFLILTLFTPILAFWAGAARAVNLDVDGDYTVSGSESYDQIHIGVTAPGTVNIPVSAALTCGSGVGEYFMVGYQKVGTLNLSGGTLTYSNPDGLWLGKAFYNGYGVMNISGGTANVDAPVHVWTGELYLSGGTLNAPNYDTILNGHTSLVSISGGTANLLSININGEQEMVSLTGGTLNLGAGGLYGDTASTINLGGGIVRASTNWSSSLPMHLNVEGTNVTFDPNGFDITLFGELSGIGGLRVNATGGTGNLVLSTNNTYTGSTLISRGTLKLDTAGLIAGTNITIFGGGVFDVTAKTTYTMDGLNTYTFGVDPAGAGLTGRIKATGLDISSARVAFTTIGLLDDSKYVVADYTSLTGTNFAVVSLPSGFAIDYNYTNGNQIVLVRIPLGTVISVR